MTIRLLAIDLDGTLFNSLHLVSTASKEAIQQAMAKGVYVVIATGRPYPFTKVVAESLGLNGPVITHNGAYIADYRNDQVLFVSRIPTNVTVRILTKLLSYPFRIVILHESFALTNRTIDKEDILERIHEIGLIKYYLAEKYPWHHVPNDSLFSYIRKNQISPPSILVMGEKAEIRKAWKMLTLSFADMITVTSSGNGLEITSKGISKATGLKFLNEKMIKDRESIMAIGDHYNDLTMLRYAGIGVAMGNSPSTIRKRADFVTKTNDEDGLAAAIHRFILPTV